MVDKDGLFTYSHIVYIKQEPDNNTLTVYPNPASEYVIFTHPAAHNAAQISVVDMAGKVMKVRKTDNQAAQTKLEVQGLAPGV